MANENLAVYLNDHLAGSTAALELLENLAAEEAGIARPLAELRSDIEADRNQLLALMRRLDIAESRTRKFGAWLTEKASRLKLRADGALGRFESLEALGLGIHGKLGLWRALEAAVEVNPALRGLDYERLTRRAEEQRQRVEALRLDAGKAALA
jgi:hypothetical protein